MSRFFATTITVTDRGSVPRPPTFTMRRIQIIEDDPIVAELQRTILEAEGFVVVLARNGYEGLTEIRASQPDLLILDVMLPGLSGLDICSQIRSQRALSRLPVMMLTSRGSESERVLGLEMGADDYLVKPFGTQELVARVKALLRRTAPTDAAAPLITTGNLVVDADSLRVTVAGEELPLTALEFRLLHFLASHPDRVFSRERLLNSVWGESHFVAPRIVDVYIRQLRKKLQAGPGAPDPIKTVRGAGYSWRVAPDIDPALTQH